jgi:hypothetical protein
LARFVNPLIRNNFVDGNILNDVADGENDAVAEIIRLKNDERLLVLLPYSVVAELNNPRTPPHVRRAASEFIRSEKVTLTQEEWRRYYDLLEAAIGNAEIKNIADDLFHVCEAAKYGSHFITRDKRLLKRADLIRSVVGVEVVSPRGFIDTVEIAKGRSR